MIEKMNTHFSFRTDGSYLQKMPEDSSYNFIKLFIEQPGNDHAKNYLIMGKVMGSLKDVLEIVKQNDQGEQITFHIDDNDETELYWYADDGWHFIITLQNEGKSIILTRTHARHKKESAEYEFYSFLQ